jgi:hypothetical protein
LLNLIIHFSASWKKVRPKICLEVKILDASIFNLPASSQINK